MEWSGVDGHHWSSVFQESTFAANKKLTLWEGPQLPQQAALEDPPGE